MQNMGTLQVTMPSERVIAMTRVFDAPRNRVFDAWTKPELLKHWLGVVNSASFEVCEVDLTPGGARHAPLVQQPEPAGRVEPRFSEPVAHATTEASEVSIAVQAEVSRIDVER